MRRMLVTGGAGFIGSNFVHYWLKNSKDDFVFVLDALTYAGNMANLEPVKDDLNYQFVHGDILDLDLIENLFQKEKIDTIVHFAAESHVDRSILGPDAFIQTNILGTHNLLKAAKKCWLDSNITPNEPRFHHVSTDEVYGSLEPNDPAFTETTSYKPNSPYSASKASSDHLVRSYYHTYGLPVTTSNCSNNYGPYQFPEKLIPLLIVNSLEGKSLPIYGDGKNIRDWLYVDDHNRAIELILDKGDLGEVYNIGGNNELTNLDIVNAVCRILDVYFESDQDLGIRFPNCPAANGKQVEQLVTYVKDRPGHDRRYAIDASKITNQLGYQPQENFESGLKKTIRWFLDNESWWRAVMDGRYRNWTSLQYSIK